MIEVPKITEEQEAIIKECLASNESSMRFISRLNKGEFVCVKEEHIGNFVMAFITEKYEIIEDEIKVGDWISYSISAIPEDFIEYGEVESISEKLLGIKEYKIKDKYEILDIRVIKKLNSKEKEEVIEEEVYRKIHSLNADEKYSILEKIREIRKSYENTSSTTY